MITATLGRCMEYSWAISIREQETPWKQQLSKKPKQSEKVFWNFQLDFSLELFSKQDLPPNEEE